MGWDRNNVVIVIARSVSDEAIQSSGCRYGLLRFARNDGGSSRAGKFPWCGHCHERRLGVEAFDLKNAPLTHGVMA
jgi:hypothetical protein